QQFGLLDKRIPNTRSDTVVELLTQLLDIDANIVAQFKKLTVKMIVAFIVKQSGSFEFALQERKRVVGTIQRLLGIGSIASKKFTFKAEGITARDLCSNFKDIANKVVTGGGQLLGINTFGPLQDSCSQPP